MILENSRDLSTLYMWDNVLNAEVYTRLKSGQQTKKGPILNIQSLICSHLQTSSLTLMADAMVSEPTAGFPIFLRKQLENNNIPSNTKG